MKNIRMIQKGQIIEADSNPYAFENLKILMAS
jgi:hypothetical protein